VYKDKAELTIEKIKNFYAANAAIGSYADIPVYNDMRELLSLKNVDAVVIATPDHWHAAAAVRAAEAGKDIYCEKSLALTIKEGRAMVNATRKYNRVFQTGSMQRSWPEFRQAVELVRNGYIGEVKSVKLKYYGLKTHRLNRGLKVHLVASPFFNFVYYASFKKVCRS
jgi:predicted dehydrogenase